MEALACLICGFQSFLGFNNESAERRREKRVAYGRVLWARPRTDTHIIPLHNLLVKYKLHGN